MFRKFLHSLLNSSGGPPVFSRSQAGIETFWQCSTYRILEAALHFTVDVDNVGALLFPFEDHPSFVQ